MTELLQSVQNTIKQLLMYLFVVLFEELAYYFLSPNYLLY